ncbi:MAG: hypothetical protein HW383_429 [Candidatus Magasanikbacteria bacterium]|nr:hypothetical protein [Candidatus Magasanikbacteria bacterium]
MWNPKNLLNGFSARVIVFFKSVGNFFRTQLKQILITFGVVIAMGAIAFVVAPSPTIKTNFNGEKIDIKKDVSFTFHFSQKMNRASVERSIKFIPSIAGSYKWEGNNVTFDPAYNLEKGTVYEMTVTRDARAWFGKGLKAAFTQKFSVLNYPEVTVFTPPNNAEVRPAQILTVLFDRPMRTLTNSLIVPPQLKITPVVKGTYNWLGTSGYEFVPTTGWAPATTYIVILAKGVKFNDGSALGEDYITTFHTPNVSVRMATDEPIRQKDAALLFFNYPVNPLSVRNSITIYARAIDEKGQAVVGSEPVKLSNSQFDFTNAKVNEGGKKIVQIKKRDGYELGKQYEFILPQGFTGGVGPNGLQAAWSNAVITGNLGLRVVATQPVSGKTKAVRDRAVIYFNNRIDDEDLKKFVTVTPELKNLNVSFGSFESGLFIYGRWQASTQYTIAVSKDLTDAYGQHLAEPYTLTFDTDPYDSDAWLQGYSQTGVLAAHLPRVYQVRTMNMTKPVTATLCKVPSEDFFLNQNSCDQIGVKQYDTAAELNSYKILNLDLDEIAGKRAPGGFYRLNIAMPDTHSRRGSSDTESRLLAVADTVLTTKVDHGGKLLIWATDMKTGEPVGNLPLEVFTYQTYGNDRKFERIIKGQTDQNGAALLAAPEKNNDRTLAVLADGNGHFGVNTTGWDDGISPWNFSLDYSYKNLLRRQIGYLYTDRRIYRPDQLVYFKGVIRRDIDAQLQLPDAKEVDVVFTDESGNNVGTIKAPVSEYGTFHGEFQLNPSMQLGTHTFYVSLEGEQVSGYFDVREFRRPDFKVTVGTPTDILTSGKAINIPVHSEYYYGAPLSGASVEYTVSRRALYFQPLQGEWYSYSEREDSYCYWYCRSDNDFENIKTGTAVLDSNGNFNLNLPSGLTDYKTSATYQVNVTVTDVNKRQVSANSEVNVHKGDFYLGIRSDYSEGWSGPKAAFDLVAVNPEGTIHPNLSGTVKFYKRTWSNVKKEGVNGDTFYDWVNTDTLLESKPFIIGLDGKANVSFTPDEGGEFVAVAETTDDHGRRIAASVSRYVYKGEEGTIRISDDQTMKIIQTKADYQVGETAELLVQTPFAKAKALVTIERETIREYRVIDLDTNHRTIQIPITGSSVPNIYVSVVTVKGGGDGAPELRVGYANLMVNTAGKVLDLKVTPDKAVYRPGNNVTLDVRTRRSDGTGVSAEVSIGVVDERVVALLGAIDKNILGRFWFTRSIGVTTANTLTQLIKKVFVETQGDGMGGGKGEESPAVRGNFLDTAFWKADVITDGDGRATVNFKLPDNLTSWQILAIGATKDTIVGATEAKIITRRDLMVEPLLPRLMRHDDTAVVGATVFNNTDRAMTASVEITAEGVGVSGESLRTVTLGAKSRSPIYWVVKASITSMQAKFRVQVKGNGLEDGFEVSIPILPYSVPEATTASNIFGRTATEKIQIPDQIIPGAGEVKVAVTTNVGSGLGDSVKYLVDFEYGCSEQTTSALIAALLYEELVAKKLAVGDEALLKKAHAKVGEAIKRLIPMQRSDGGFGFWSESTQTYPHLTAYVFWGLSRAQAAGYDVDREVLNRAQNYLREYLARPFSEQARYYLNERAQVLAMVADYDAGNLGGYAQSVYEARDELAVFGKAYLAMALQKIDGSDARAKSVLGEISAKVVFLNSSTAYITEDTGYNDYFMNSDVRSTSIYLQALLRITPKDEMNDRLIRWLTTQRLNGYWMSTQSTAMTLIGLADYVTKHPISEKASVVQVYLDSALAETLPFEKGDLSGERQVEFPISTLLAKGADHEVSVKKDSDTHYFYDVTMRVYREIEKIASFENGFSVTSEVYSLKDAKRLHPLSSARQGETVRVRMRLVSTKAHRFVAFEDHLPAGLEPIDFTLKTSPQQLADKTQQCFPDWSGESYCLADWEYDWWWENVWSHTELRDDRVFLFAENLRPGVYEYEFLAQAVTPGEFRVPPTRAYEFYNPSANGHNEGKVFKVNAR